MGDYDVVKAVLEQLGTLEWWQVAIKPAKPFAFGMVDGTPIFGLPGNPVSSHVSFELFARPALRRMMGHTEIDRPVVRAVAGAALGRRPDGRLHLDRVRVTLRGRPLRGGAQRRAGEQRAVGHGLGERPRPRPRRRRPRPATST